MTPVAKPYLWWVDNRSVMCADTSNGQVVTQFTASDVVSGLSIDEVNHNLYFQIGYWTGLWRTDVDGTTFTNLVDELYIVGTKAIGGAPQISNASRLLRTVVLVSSRNVAIPTPMLRARIRPST